MASFSRNVEAGIQQMCESVFVRLCHMVGTSKQVAIRREVKDITEMVLRQMLDSDDDAFVMLSGSRREGFRLMGSDMDTMHCLNNIRVIWDMSQSEYYSTATKTLLFADISESPPGFTLLELLTPTTNRNILSSCVRMNDRLYISSSIFRKITRSPGSTEHGPCASKEVGGVEFDYAFCFVCDFWPPSASLWTDRCHSWPDKEVVDDIVRNGCHFVAIGNPLGVHGHEHKEWRISFSLAEYKLVHTMNHCQFLTYGLLKIFLKEVIDKQSDETNKLLCSYHMKTAVFWVIQQNTIPFWSPQNLLAGFWVCFKLLLKWVYEGVCPNFFIPQNNLFLSKVHGSAQRSLFLQLHGLYERGLACLLLSPSISSDITYVLYNPRLYVCTDEDRMKNEVHYDIELFSEIVQNRLIFNKNLYSCIKFLYIMEQLIGSSLTQYQVLMLQRLTASVLQDTAFKLHNMHTDAGLSKQMYIADRMSCHMLKLAETFGCISDMMHIVMYYYKTSRYSKALSVIGNMKVRLAQPYLMYNGSLDGRRYIEAVGGLSFSTKMRKAGACNFYLNNHTRYITELELEQQCSHQNGRWVFVIPLFVLLHFVEFLCYRHIDTTLSQAALDELHVLVHHDQGIYILEQQRDISWQILGICHQITGNHRAALYAYQQSLQQYPYNRIQTATQMRIHELQII